METLITIQLKNQQRYFSLLIKALVEKFKPEQIYCFGKNMVSTEKNGCFMEPHADTQCHYFLLVVTESITRMEHEMQDYANSIPTSDTITILSHGKQAIAEALTANNRFFHTVYRTAQLVYSRNGFLYREAIPPFNPAQMGSKALKDFNHRMEMVDGFLAGANECLNEDQFNVCVFLLHQTVQQACMALIKVYLAYRTDIYNLHRLLHLCSCFAEEPLKILLHSGIKNDERLFNLLIKSHSAARYNNIFNVDVEDANALFDRVMDFVPLVKEMCKRKIVALEMEAQTFRQQQRESEVRHD